jgi:hypothetical protein
LEGVERVVAVCRAMRTGRHETMAIVTQHIAWTCISSSNREREGECGMAVSRTHTVWRGCQRHAVAQRTRERGGRRKEGVVRAAGKAMSNEQEGRRAGG